MNNSRKAFADNLQRLMAEAGKTRTEVCTALGFKYSTFTDWVNGTKYPRIDKIEMLADYFGVEKSDLIEEKQPPVTEGLSEKDQRLVDWFRSLPPEKQQAILIAQDGPIDAL